MSDVTIKKDDLASMELQILEAFIFSGRFWATLVVTIAASYFIVWAFNAALPEDFSVDLTEFTGRVISVDKIKPPSNALVITVPFDEASRWGQDAILSYGTGGVTIWKPDNKTGSVFLYSDEKHRSVNASYHYRIKKSGNVLFFYDAQNNFVKWGGMIIIWMSAIIGLGLHFLNVRTQVVCDRQRKNLGF